MLKALPLARWLSHYQRDDLTGDLSAGLIVAVVMIPQALAYSLLAGLPPQMGLYASILPLIGYALFSSSPALAVGPVAVIALMTASAIGNLPAGTPAIPAAIALAGLSGILLLVMGILRLGFVANLLSHPVIAGFISAAALLIALNQLPLLLGIPGGGDTLPKALGALWHHAGQWHLATTVLGSATVLALLLLRYRLIPVLQRLGVAPRTATLASRLGPAVVVIATTAISAIWNLESLQVRVVGSIPAGLPSGLAEFRWDLPWRELLVPALMLSLIGFAESIAIAHTLAARRRQRINSNQELLGLGLANIASAGSGGYPVTGGFARSVVNFDSGARTPVAGIITALVLAITALWLTPWLYPLPRTTLAATILVAVFNLIDWHTVRETWRYSRSDFGALLITALMALLWGVEAGVVAGIGASVALLLWRNSRPHMAQVGLVPGTQHFRNVSRQQVLTSPQLISLRVDESLTFANANYLEDQVEACTRNRPELQHVVLMCTAINHIDASALESLEHILEQLRTQGVKLHLSEVKGPVMDQLCRSDFLQHLSGQVFRSQFDAVAALAPELVDAPASILEGRP